MFKKEKLFFYSEETVSYVEAKRYRAKLTAGVIVSTIVLLSVMGMVNNYYGDVFGLGFKTATELAEENSLLKDQVRMLNTRLSDISGVVTQLAYSDNQLRTAVNLPKIDLDTRAMGTGGASVEKLDGLVSKDANELLTSSGLLLDKLEKELIFQRQSYNQIHKKQEENKILFSSMPAIKPMVGTYSYHGFGMRRDPFLGVLRPHEGVDIHGDIGTPINATGDGIVEFSGNTGSSYGIAVEINHGFGYKTWYAHLSRVVARSGQRVKRGQLIAYSGNTGRSTGPHLHYEVRRNGTQQNPVEYFVDDVDYEKIKSQLAAIQ
ncbi:MAG: M23 family metallopeptidase [Ignavibacteriales bacterium]|nr:M23 family metallopeptidase [Ignavibacteriales bacterium]